MEALSSSEMNLFMFIKKNNILRREFMYFSYTKNPVLPTVINTKPRVVRLEIPVSKDGE